MKETSSSRRSRCLRSLGWIVLSIPVLLAIGALFENWRGRRAWAEYKAEANARGDKLEIAEIIPAPVPDAENFAAAPLFRPLFELSRGPNGEFQPRDPAAKKALEGIDPLTPRQQYDWREGHRVDLDALQALYQSRSDFPKPETAQPAAEGVLLALSKFHEPYAELREACQRPLSRFPIKYELRTRATAPHLLVLMKLSK